MRKILFRLTAVALYVGLLWTGITGTANAETQFSFAQSAKVSGALAANVFGDGETGQLNGSHFFSNPIELIARGRGEGELMIRIKGPHGFSKVYNLELDPNANRSINIFFRPADNLTTGESSRSETSDTISATVEFNTTGLTGQLNLSASCSGALTNCEVSFDDRDGNLYRTISANNFCCGPGHGRIRVGSIIDVDQNE